MDAKKFQIVSFMGASAYLPMPLHECLPMKKKHQGFDKN